MPLLRSTVEAWVRERIDCWPLCIVLHLARIVDRLLDFLAAGSAIERNPLADLRNKYEQRNTAAIVHALLAAVPDAAIEALKPMPRFASFLEDVMRHHIDLKHALGDRYSTQAEHFSRFDRFLQGRPDLIDQPLPVLLQQWHVTRPTLEHEWVCQQLGRDLAKALRRIDPSIALPPVDRWLCRKVKQQRRQPYIYTPSEVRCLLDTAREFPSPFARCDHCPFTQ